MSETIGRGLPRRQFLIAAGAAAAAVAQARTVTAFAQPPAIAHGGNVLDAVRRACHTMQSVFNADDHDIPWFGHQCVPFDPSQTRFSFNAWFEEAHVPGRHLNALLEARSLGVSVADSAIAKHRDAAYLALSRQVPLPQNRWSPRAPEPHIFVTHNIREGMHAMYALYRHSPPDAAEARRRMERMIAAIDTFWTPDRAWSHPKLQAAQPGIDIQEWGTFVTGLARAIGPLAKYWNATRERGEESGAARALLQVLREEALERFPATGVGRDLGDHTHSITCTMSGLAQLADFTGDDELMSRVLAFYRVGSTDMRDELGWSQENMGDNSDRGEINNSGDILETALILGRHGHPEYFAEAERFIRGHILPAQLTDASFMLSPPDPWDDSVRDVGGRCEGAFGFPAPYGHRPRHHYAISFNLDIVGGGTASLCAAHREITRRDGDVLTVQMLLDAETEHAVVRSPYGRDETLHVTPRAGGTVRILVPQWAPRSQVRVLGGSGRFDADGALVVERVPAGRRVSVRIPLPEREIDLGHRYSGIRVRLRGDEVTAMESFGQDLAYFPDIPRRRRSSASRGLVARWTFNGGDDGLELYGSARASGGTLVLDGQGFASPGPASELGFGADSFTIALWMRSTMNGIGRLISRGSYIWTPGYFISLGHGGDGHIGVGIGGGQRSGAVGSVEMFTRDGGYNDDRWHHVGLIVDRERLRIRLVVDGRVAPVDQTPGTLGGATDDGLILPPGAPIVASSRNALCLGAHLGQAELFRGSLRDVRVYDRALSPSQVAALR